MRKKTDGQSAALSLAGQSVDLNFKKQSKTFIYLLAYYLIRYLLF